MPKRYRLSGLEIRNLTGKRIHGKLFSLLVAPVRGEHAKCACVVSKKVSRSAVERNKVRRRCRSLVAGRISGVAKPRALVFYAKSIAKDAEFADMRRDIEELLAKVR